MSKLTRNEQTPRDRYGDLMYEHKTVSAAWADAEIAELQARNTEHEQFRHQHRDCDAMSVENQRLRAQVLALQSCERSMRAALKPLAILLPSIDPDRPDDRVLYKVNDAAITYGDVRRAAVLTGQPAPKPIECGRCDNGEPCTNQYGICSRNGGQPHGELAGIKTQDNGIAALAKFGLAVLLESREEYGDLDGGWLQDIATECGCLEKVTVTEPCNNGNCACAEDNDFPGECYRYPHSIQLVITRDSAAPKGGSHEG